MTIEALRQRLAELQARAKSMQDVADKEKRDLTEDETKELEVVFADFESTEADISRRERLASIEARASASGGRRTTPEQPQNASRHEEQPENSRPTSAIWVPPSNQHERNRWGWKNMGDYVIAVKNASRPGGSVDQRLQNAPTTFGQESAGADGGFAVPPEFRDAIVQKVMGEESMLSRCDQLETTGNSITVPKDETTPWGTAGIQAYWEGEAALHTQKKPQLESSTVRVNKLTALVPITEELLEDAPAMASYVQSKAPQVIFWKVNDAILNGDGAGKPLGILNAGCTVTVLKESSQAAGTVKAQNVAKMWSRMPANWRTDAVWLVHSDVEPQLMSLAYQATDAANANPNGAIPLYVPPGGFSQAPYATIMGKPVMVTQAAQALGTKGDITFASLSQYMAVMKAGGLRAESSIHLWFDYSVVAYRFTFRMGGQPWWSSTFAASKGTTTYGPFINIENR